MPGWHDGIDPLPRYSGKEPGCLKHDVYYGAEGQEEPGETRAVTL